MNATLPNTLRLPRRLKGTHVTLAAGLALSLSAIAGLSAQTGPDKPAQTQLSPLRPAVVRPITAPYAPTMSYILVDSPEMADQVRRDRDDVLRMAVEAGWELPRHQTLVLQLDEQGKDVSSNVTLDHIAMAVTEIGGLGGTVEVIDLRGR